MDDVAEEIEVIRESAELHWLVLEYRGSNDPIRVNARALDRILADGHRLILDIGDYAVALHLKSGAGTAQLIVQQLQPYTRSAPIQDDVSYNLAKQLIATDGAVPLSLNEPVLLSGDTEIVARGLDWRMRAIVRRMVNCCPCRMGAWFGSSWQ